MRLAIYTVMTIIGCVVLTSTGWAQEVMPDEVHSMTVAEMLQSGGAIMIVLSILSVLTVALIIQNFLMVRSTVLVPKGFVKDAVYVLSRRDISRANDMVKSVNHIAAKMLAAAINGLNKRPEKQVQGIETSAIRGLSQVRQRINYLANVGAIAPMFGLLGTVFGMIKAFNTIAYASEGNGKSIELAGAIAEAMLTTAGGLIVGIPALGFYYFFKGRLSDVVSEVEEVAEAFGDASEGENAAA